MLCDDDDDSGVGDVHACVVPHGGAVGGILSLVLEGPVWKTFRCCGGGYVREGLDVGEAARGGSERDAVRGGLDVGGVEVELEEAHSIHQGGLHQ